MKKTSLLILVCAILLFAGCRSSLFKFPVFGKKETPVHQTEGGTVLLDTGKDGTGLKLTVEQPSNAEAPAVIEVTLATGEVIKASTGSSREDKNFGLAAKLGQYEVFTYVGAGVCILGVGLFVASFWFPLVPKTAGLMVFAGGAATAYLSTAIPDYGPYALVLSVVGALFWWIHRSAGQKHPDWFDRKKRKTMAFTPTGE